MKKILNLAEDFVDESLAGIVEAYGESLKFTKQDSRAIVRTDAKTKKKVSIVTGGGYGHLPTFLGYVGRGFCDGVAVGNVFTSPSSETICNAAMETENGKGVLLLFANYVGDCLNFSMARDMLRMQGLAVGYVAISDDVASAPSDKRKKRRGIAGIYFAYKLAGAKAEQGASLEEVEAVALKVSERIATIGFAFSGCKIPGRTSPIFVLPDDEMELGMGIHGEPGILRTKVKTAKEIAGEIMIRLVEDQKLESGQEVALLINSLGGTSKEELFLLYHEIHHLLQQRNIRVHKVLVGEYATSMEMIGASVSVCLLDDELKELFGESGLTPFVS